MPYPFQGLPPAVSVSAAILVAQQIILSREYVDWIESVGTPRTEAAVRILAAYRDWRDHRGSSDGTLIRECGFGAIEAQMTAGRIPRPAPEHLATIRAQGRPELEVLRFVVTSLKRLGESPERARDT